MKKEPFETRPAIIVPVILCGGSGARLWPASTHDVPKPFVALVGRQSGYQDALLRARAVAVDGPCLVVAGARHAELVKSQASTLGAPIRILLEPEGRDSAPAMAAAAAFIAEEDADAVMVVLSADHFIGDVEAFATTIKTALAGAARGAIVTLGVPPTHPSTAFGYIQSDAGQGDPRPVRSFVEKPDATQARAYVGEGRLWNSGIFVASARTLGRELASLAPEVWSRASEAVRRAGRDGPVTRLHDSFRAAPRISIDHAVMEKTLTAEVVTARFDWMDIGAWDAVWAAMARDDNGNAASAGVELAECHNVLARAARGSRLAVVGVRDIAVVAENGGVLVCALDRAQAVKSVAERIGASPDTAFASLAAGRRWLDRWMRVAALPLWWAAGADHDGGGFHERLDADGRSRPEPRRLRVQARQVFAYAAAGRLGWRGPFRQAAEHGLDYIERHFRRADGLYRRLCGPDGDILSDEATTYDQAFVLLAYAAAHAANIRPGDVATRAASLRTALEARRMSNGAFREIGERPYQANANMHLFEAALAWTEIDPQAWGPTADGVGAVAMNLFRASKSGVITEVFDEAWSPAPGETGRLLEPGHQFEWAWLLDWWARLGRCDEARPVAAALFAAGSKGVDDARGVAVNALRDDFSVVDGEARLWPQTEWLRAAIRFQDDRGALRAISAIRHFIDEAGAGLWRDRMGLDGAIASEAAPASSFYHLIGAWREAAPGEKPPSGPSKVSGQSAA